MEMTRLSKGEAAKGMKGEQSLSRGTLLNNELDDLSDFRKVIELKITKAEFSIKPDHQAASSKEKKLNAFV